MNPAALLDRLVSDVLTSEPAAPRVFIARRMACLGCPFAPFETISEAARAYGIEPPELAGDIAQACTVAGPSEDHHHDH